MNLTINISFELTNSNNVLLNKDITGKPYTIKILKMQELK